MSYQITDSSYGKNWVKLLHVHRQDTVHSVREWEVCTELTLSSQRDFLVGNNSQIIATDSQKNIIYALARSHGPSTPEAFAVLLCSHFLTTYSQVTHTNVRVDVLPWRRLSVDGSPHEHAFVCDGRPGRFCEARQRRGGGAAQVWSGLRDLQVLKTTQSAFSGFVRDEYTSLADTNDRIFSTLVYSKWKFADGAATVDYDAAWSSVHDAILTEFAGPARGGVFSPSVQKTLHDTQRRILQRLSCLDEIEIVMPNKHYIPVDLSQLPDTGGHAAEDRNNGQVFLPVDKPAGNIRAVLKRSKSKL